MHELSIAEAILHKVRAHAEGHAVTGVRVQIGALRQVVPDSLEFSWQVLTDPTEHRGVPLIIEQLPAVVECTACGQRTTLQLPVLSCGVCESFAVNVVSGDELQLVSMDVADD